MTCLGALKYAVVLVVFQQVAQVIADKPKDSVTRKGIILQLLDEAESKQFETDQVTIDGITYKRSGEKREKEIVSGNYLAQLQRFEQSTNPKVTFDYMALTKLTGVHLGKLVVGGRLKSLKNDDDLDDAIIQMSDPYGLEFVMASKQCAFIKTDDYAVSNTYFCGNDNFKPYSVEVRMTTS